jgi:hypothetical protein
VSHRCSTPDQCWREFWTALVFDGAPSDAKVRAELFDYHGMMGEVAAAYDEVTGGRISKPNTLAREVAAVVEDRLEERYQEGYDDAQAEAAKTRSRVQEE